MPTEPKSPISIRPATVMDADEIVEIEASSFVSEEFFSFRQIKRLIANPNAISIVAQETHGGVSRTLGWSVALIRSHPRWQSGRIYSVAVAHPAKGRGIGRLLVQSLLERLQGVGISRVYLEVRADNEPAIALYASLGFVPVAELLDYYAEGVHGIRMRWIRPTDQPALSR